MLSSGVESCGRLGEAGPLGPGGLHTQRARPGVSVSSGFVTKYPDWGLNSRHFLLRLCRLEVCGQVSAPLGSIGGVFSLCPHVEEGRGSSGASFIRRQIASWEELHFMTSSPPRTHLLTPSITQGVRLPHMHLGDTHIHLSLGS